MSVTSIDREYILKDCYKHKRNCRNDPIAVYVAKIIKMDDDDLVNETCKMIYLSALAGNNHKSDYHWMVDICYDEFLYRGKIDLYDKAYNKACRQAGY